MRVSVVIASHNRHAALHRLLIQLATQTIGRDEFEVIVVDDGSLTPVAASAVPYALTILRQANHGASAARHAGAAHATGDILLFLDDDMEVPDVLLAEHARLHERDPRAVVLGRIRSPSTSTLPLFERFHARYLEDLGRDAQNGQRTLTGIDVYSGNLSMRRSQYMRVGGFDVALGQSEDAELGLRLERDGAVFSVSETAFSIHHSDHVSLGAWMKRTYRYGRVDVRISRKHPQMPHASPWRYVRIVTPVSGVFLGLALAAPTLGHLVARAVMRVATSLDAVGLERAALAGTDLAFGMNYTRGLHDESGGLMAALRDLNRYRKSKHSQRIGRSTSS